MGSVQLGLDLVGIDVCELISALVQDKEVVQQGDVLAIGHDFLVNSNSSNCSYNEITDVCSAESSSESFFAPALGAEHYTAANKHPDSKGVESA